MSFEVDCSGEEGAAVVRGRGRGRGRGLEEFSVDISMVQDNCRSWECCDFGHPLRVALERLGTGKDYYMSDSPVIFKRSKSKPGQRARQKSPDANDATSDFTSQGDESPITLASKLKNKAKRAKPKSRLSFGGDDDEVCVITVVKELILMGGAMEGAGEVFQVKKSNLSQKLKLGTHPASPAYVLYTLFKVDSTQYFIQQPAFIS